MSWIRTKLSLVVSLFPFEVSLDLALLRNFQISTLKLSIPSEKTDTDRNQSEHKDFIMNLAGGRLKSSVKWINRTIFQLRERVNFEDLSFLSEKDTLDVISMENAEDEDQTQER